uniref:Putative secreted peptide n=1 Tax=Anopheles braziliensis TaxID=58242 RepID=A0A2M3ZQ98_9DIPT
MVMVRWAGRCRCMLLLLLLDSRWCGLDLHNLSTDRRYLVDDRSFASNHVQCHWSIAHLMRRQWLLSA